jgi:hypothetical protein
MIQIILLLGIPSQYVEAVTELEIAFVDSKTNTVLVKYDKTSTRTEYATIYKTMSGKSGAELADTFQDVMKQIKDSFANNIRSGKIKLPKTASR